MSVSGLKRLCYRDRVLGVLRDEIKAGLYPPGTRMPSLRALSARLHASVFPIYEAMVRLEQEGYVARRHGSGTYVQQRPPTLQMADSAVLCMESTGHVFGELTSLLCRRLQDLGLFASILDMGDGNGAELLRRAQRSDARFLIMRGSSDFPFGELKADPATRRHSIAVLAWESDLLLDRVHRVVVDHGRGSRLLADHLWAAGHRHVLLAGPKNMIPMAAGWDGIGECPTQLLRPGTGFAAMWKRLGGTLATFVSLHTEEKISCNRTELMHLIDAAPTPTAVVGMRDVDTWDARKVLRRLRPHSLDRLAFAGDGDTPWAHTFGQPIVTLNWNLDRIAELACGIIREIEAGKRFKQPVVHLVPPRLVVRG